MHRRLELERLEAREVLTSTYGVAWLGVLNPADNFSAAQGINDLGQVVGNSYVQDANGIPTTERAFLYDPATGMVDLGAAGATGAFAWDISDTGRITGWVHDGGSSATGGYWEWAAIWDNGVGHTIPGYGQPGMASVAYGVNDVGIVVGHSDVVGQLPNGEAFKYDGSTLTFLGTLGGKWSYGMDVNNSNVIAGFADTGENPSTDPNVYMSRYHAVIWSASGVIQDLGTLGTDSYAYKINATGQVVGSSLATDGFYHAFLFDGARMIDIGAPNANSQAHSINDAGQIVGDSVNWLNSRAFLYENGATYDLNTLVVGLGSDVILSAHDINNIGQIVGYGMHNGRYEACLLTPGGQVIVTNDPPTASVGGPYSIVEGGALQLDATLSVDPDGDPLTYRWDVNGDGVYGDAVGATPSLIWNDLSALGIAGGNTYALSVQVNDGHGHTVVDLTLLTVAAKSTGPTAFVSGPTDGYHGVTGQLRTLVLTADGDAPDGFEFRVEWGDGSYDTVNGPSGTTASHVYDAAGAFTASVVAVDADGRTSAAAVVNLDIRRAELQGGVLAVGGTSADDVLTLAAGATAGTIATPFGTFAAGQVMVYGDKGSDRVVVQGTTGADSFAINADSAAVNGVVVRGTAVENWTADGLAGNDVFDVDGPTTGVALVGGDGNDRFNVVAAGNARIDGGLGTDALDYARFAGPVVVNLQAKTATGTGGVAGIETYAGSGSLDSFIATNAANTWIASGNDAGAVNGVQFSSFENWIGGAGADAFKMAAAKYVSGTIDGGAGTNTLDYSTYTTQVTVNLALGAATNVGGVTRIANVFGGAAGDALTGDSGDNVLLGNAGNDVLHGGAGGNDVLVGGAGNDSLAGGDGRNILIGGLGADVIVGGLGEDILVGGTTGFDADVAALTALMAEWKRTDLTYQQRIDHLTGAKTGGQNGKYRLNSKTVKDDRTVDRMTGGGGLDWFWGQAAEVIDPTTGERRN